MANDSSSGAGASKRARFNFWLDLSKALDWDIHQLIASLKDQRLFTQTIRDGIRLICDLRAGNLDVLFELFPWVRSEFLKYLSEIQPAAEPHAAAPAPASDPSHQSLDAARQALQEERRKLAAERQKLAQAQAQHQDQLLSKLEAWLLEQQGRPADHAPRPTESPPQASGGPKPLGVPSFSAPTFDDEDEDDLLTVRKDTNAGRTANENFLRSFLALTGG